MTRRIGAKAAWVLAAAICAWAWPAPAQMNDIPHPFLLWTPDEAAAIRKRLDSDPMAARQYERMASTDIAKLNPTLWNLFNYMVRGDEKAGRSELAALLAFIGRRPEPLTWNIDLSKLQWNVGMPSSGDRHMRDEQTLNTLRYDVLYDRLTPQQRKGVEDAMRSYIRFHLDGHKPWHPAFHYDRTSWLPNMHWPRAIGTHVMAVALKDEKLIKAMFECPMGGFKWFLDQYIADGQFYMEEPGKYYSNIGTMLLWCEGLRRLGLDQYGYGYVGKEPAGDANGMARLVGDGPRGTTMRKYIAMKIVMGYPRLEAPAGGTPTYTGVAMGDAGGNDLVDGYDARGRGGNRWWSTAHMNGPVPKSQVPLWFEYGQARWPDDGFDYFLAQMRKGGEEVYLPTLYLNLRPIDPKKVKPPPAKSYVTRERGFAMLRADESPNYWEGPAPAVAMQFGMYYVHYVHDCFATLGFVANNRIIYERMGAGTRRGYAGGDEWRDHVRGHCGIVVDALKAQPVDNGNEGCKNQRIRQDLAGPGRFVACRAKGVYPDVDMERAMVLTHEYLLDVSRLSSDKPRVYDWQVLAHGLLQGLDDAKTWTPLDKLPADGEKKFTRPHLEDMHVSSAGEKPWSVVILQSHLPRGVGVRVGALGEDGTTVLASGPPGMGKAGSGTSLMITRNKPATVFAVLHEPFAGGPDKARLAAFERLAQDDRSLAVRIAGPAAGQAKPVDDRVLLAYGDGVEERRTVAAGADSFTFAGFALVRIAPDKVQVQGNLTGMKLHVAGAPKLVVNGKQAAAAVAGGVMTFEAVSPG